jgi:thymidylate synthase ThyX
MGRLFRLARLLGEDNLMIEAKIVADSICGTTYKRIISFVLTYPRFILAEINTHRMFSRNSASSRAIPIEKMIKRIIDNPATPIYWGKNQKGMQASAELSAEEIAKALKIWQLSTRRQIKYAGMLSQLGVHKQIANRLLEPFAHMTTLLTATEFGNFFNLRAHRDAQPEFQELAFQMLQCYLDSTPKVLQPGEWHLPFADKYISEYLTLEQRLKITTARAARVSYISFEGDIDHQKDYKLHDQLVESGHWSPFEHAAQALSRWECLWDRLNGYSKQANYRGYMPYRKKFLTENKSRFNAEQLLQSRRGEHGKNR